MNENVNGLLLILDILLTSVVLFLKQMFFN